MNHCHTINPLKKVIVFCVYLTVVFLAKYPTLNLPPIWDSVSGVFAPAIFLFETGFDYSALLDQPGWWLGGANTHSHSIITLITAITIHLTSGDGYFIYLHLLNFGLTALILTVQYHLISPHYGRKVAILISLITFLYPLFFVQSGYMYTEIAGSTFFILVLASWYFRLSSLAIVFGILAVLTKSFGVVSTISISLLLLFEFSRRSPLDLTIKLKIASIAIVTFLIEILRLYITPDAPANRPTWNPLIETFDRLLLTPDTLVLLCIGITSTIYLFINKGLFSPANIYIQLLDDIKSSRPIHIFLALSLYFLQILVMFDWLLYSAIKSLLLSTLLTLSTYLLVRKELIHPILFIKKIRNDLKEDDFQRLFIGTTTFVFIFVLFIITASLTLPTFVGLTRYYTWIIPITLINVLLFITTIIKNSRKAKHREPDHLFLSNAHWKIIIGCSIAAVMVTNLDGKYYPQRHELRHGCSRLERSMEYLDYYLQQKNTASLIEQSQNMPFFLPLSYYYLASSPLMGYTKQQLSNTKLILDDPYRSSDLEHFPKQFGLVSSYGTYGDTQTDRVLSKASIAGCDINMHISSKGDKYDQKLYIVDCLTLHNNQ